MSAVVDVLVHIVNLCGNLVEWYNGTGGWTEGGSARVVERPLGVSERASELVSLLFSQLKSSIDVCADGVVIVEESTLEIFDGTANCQKAEKTWAESSVGKAAKSAPAPLINSAVTSTMPEP